MHAAGLIEKIARSSLFLWIFTFLPRFFACIDWLFLLSYLCMESTLFELDHKRITVFPGPSGSPAVYLNCYEDPSNSLNAMICLPHSLICISHIDWDNDLTPWPADSLQRRDPPFAGKADAYLAWLKSQVIPTVERNLDTPSYRIIGGYSLGGLFAVYSVYQSDLFSRCASASGSLWYPGFLDYCASHAFSSSLTHVYLSLGDKEPNTRQPMLARVGSCTEDLYHLFDAQGIRSVFEWNPGNHFVDNEERMSKGITWCLTQEQVA